MEQHVLLKKHSLSKTKCGITVLPSFKAVKTGDAQWVLILQAATPQVTSYNSPPAKQQLVTALAMDVVQDPENVERPVPGTCSRALCLVRACRGELQFAWEAGATLVTQALQQRNTMELICSLRSRKI